MSSAGLLTGTIEQFMASSLQIVAEVQVSRSLVLLGNSGGFDGINRVYGDSASFSQTAEWVQSNLSDVERVLVADCFAAAERVQAEEGSAVIGPEELSASKGLKVLAKSLGADAELAARFFVAGKAAVQPTGRDKTSLIAAVQDRSGALYEMLSPFAKHDVTMTKIESKPMRNRSGEYIFFVDLNGHEKDDNLSAALEEVKPFCSYLRVLGSYPSFGG
jgi:chorismate mutase/prephenate dehydratase